MSFNEQLARLGLTEVMLRTMRNKEEIVRTILGILEGQKRAEDGLANFVKAIDEGKTSNEQLGQMLRTVVRVQREQAGSLRQLAMVALIYSAGGDLTSDAAKVACNLGAGQEALQEMFRAKMRGG
jgi:hypothetical protein